ncbi:roadblock/LC7 domain-containing protein [Nonomuraea sp. MG754425]|uniref:roadblock/LC7 domain-containing protein n=1 Tax=Nonomuraea sp. MG754425 TaxID=2570319 RepID=UPI001F196942|nr:roadblock/LC7 domain-containing protein [Nonomuraea sp. MG754425]MCF6470348.1 roadblock/LC7 domain-containing protein [Nonomuraea sp. MG754425]
MLGIDTCLAEVMSIPGALDAMLVDHTSGMAVAFSAADGVDADRSAAALTEALRATTDGLARSCPGEVVRIDDMLVTTDKGHHLLRLLETVFEGPLVIYVRLDLERSNLALARYRLRAISGELAT